MFYNADKIIKVLMIMREINHGVLDIEKFNKFARGTVRVSWPDFVNRIKNAQIKKFVEQAEYKYTCNAQKEIQQHL